MPIQIQSHTSQTSRCLIDFIRTMDLLFKKSLRFLKQRVLWLSFHDGATLSNSNLTTRLIFNLKQIGIRARPLLPSSRTEGLALTSLGCNNLFQGHMTGLQRILLFNMKTRTFRGLTFSNLCFLHSQSQDKNNQLALKNLFLTKVIWSLPIHPDRRPTQVSHQIKPKSAGTTNQSARTLKYCRLPEKNPLLP